MALALGLLADACVEQASGQAKALSPGRQVRVVEATRSENPEEYKGIMSYQWIRGFALLGCGYFLLSRIRRADRLDPFSTGE